MDAPNAWSAQPVFGYERFPLPQVHPDSPSVARALPPTTKVKRPAFAFPPPRMEMTPDETATAFSNSENTTTGRVLDAADTALARLPGALLLAIGIFAGTLGAYGILSALQPDRVTPRVAATFVQESPRPAILAKPTLVTARTGIGTAEAATPRRAFAARLPVRRPAR